MHKSVFVFDHQDSIYTHFYDFFSFFQTFPDFSRRLQTFPDKNSEIFLAQLFAFPSWVQCNNQFLSSTTQTRFIVIFMIFLALSRPFQKKILKLFSSTFSPILGEFNAPFSFCQRPPRLDLYSFLSFFSSFQTFPDLSRPFQTTIFSAQLFPLY